MRRLGLLSLALLAACGEVAEPPVTTTGSAVAAAPGDARYKRWRELRAERQAALDAYIAEHRDGFEAFAYGALGKSGVPTAMLQVFPRLLPGIWGAPGHEYEPQGFTKDPWDPTNPTPLGLATTAVPTPAGPISLTTLSCGGCHIGRVEGPDGQIITLVGAPNTRFNQFRTAVETTVMHPVFDAVFGGSFSAQSFKQKVLQRRTLNEKTLGAYTYSLERFANAPDLNTLEKPGFLDAIAVALAPLTLPELLDPAQAMQVIVDVLPPAPAQADIPSLWRQRARALAQWDGSSAGSPVYRNLAAAVGVIGDPALVDYANARATAAFAADLPPPPYPFDVDLAKAEQGRVLFGKYCAGCHHDNNPAVYPASFTGTDPNRTLTITAGGRVRLIGALRAACSEPAVCDVPDDTILRDMDDPATGGRGYPAPPLDGIWARAPYLHNGAVPTLYHLLMPAERPTTFVRGSVKYDQDHVGFAWDDAALVPGVTHVFDTTEAGASNAGHDGAAFLGIDWAKFPHKRDALLEYLKTL